VNQEDIQIAEKSRYKKFMTIDVNEALKALANPTRLAILNWLKDPRTNFPEQEVDPETVGVCVSIIQERTGLSQSTTSLYLAALQRAQLVTSQRIGPWTYYKRHDENIDAFLKALKERI
jgi:ArsR family transcriptional regulator